MNRHEAKSAVIALRGLTVEDFRAWPVDGGVWLIEERDPSLRPSDDGLVWAVLPSGEVLRRRPGSGSEYSMPLAGVAEPASLDLRHSAPDSLGTIFPELAGSELSLQSSVMDKVAATARHRSALRRIRRYSGVGSISSLMCLTVADVQGWPGIGNHNIQDVLTYLDRVRRSPDAIDPPKYSNADTASPTARSVAPVGPAKPGRDPAWDPLAGRLGDVLPPLHLLADVDLRSPWLEDLARSAGYSKAIASLRHHTEDGATIGDLLKMHTELMPGIRGANPMLGAHVLDFLTQLATQAYETRESAIEIVSSWIASTSGRATWSNIATLAFNPKPVEVQQAWATLASMPITVRPVPSAPSIISEFIENLSDEDRTILLECTIATRPRTYEELGEQFAMSASAVRSRETSLEALIRRDLVNSEPWRPVEWACQAYRQRGASSPPEDPAPGNDASELGTIRRFIAWLCRYNA